MASGKWSTEKVNEILKQIDETGVMPRHNPFYERDVDLRDAKLDYSYTKEELVTMAKIKHNILYFGENFAEVMTDEGNRTVKLRPYQKRTLLQLKKYRFNVWLASRQVGKCVTFDTEVVIFSKESNKYLAVPIFEVHYGYKEELNFLHRVEYKLFKILYKIKKKINQLESSH